MIINIQGVNFDLTEAIKRRIIKKIKTALKKSSSRVIHIDVEVEKTTRHHKKGELFLAQANVQVPGKVLHLEAVHEDFYATIEDLKDKMERELVKTKEMYQTKKRKQGHRIRLMKSIFFWRGKSD